MSGPHGSHGSPSGSWRARLGWGLLAAALVLICFAVPVWALAGGDLSDVASWANVFALPVSAVGVVFVFVDHNRASRQALAPDANSRPWMAPPLARIVERPDLSSRLVAALTDARRSDVGLTTELHGVGGFGKTQLAAWACHQREIARRFTGGLLWVTIGQGVTNGPLAERINSLVFALSGQRPTVSDPDAAGWELGLELDRREPVLLVIDDVWEETQLRPFRLGGRACTRLVTTRVPGLLKSGDHIRVDAMSADQARELVTAGVTGLSAASADRLANQAGRWPVLLNLVNGALRRRISQGQPPDEAAADIWQQIAAEGPTTLDPLRPADRGQAVAATIEASLALLGEADRDSFFDLAIFPEDVEIPTSVLRLLWPDARVDAVCQELVALGLAVAWRWQPGGHRLLLHDMVRGYLRARRNAAARSGTHRRLVEAAAGLLPGGGAGGEWWSLPPYEDYLWRYLTEHMHGAAMIGEVTALASDLRWIEAKTRLFGSVASAEADLAYADGTPARLLRQVLHDAGPLLGPIDPPRALGATLASRLCGVRELRPFLDRFTAAAPPPLLEAVWPVADRRDPSATTSEPGHTGGVKDCAFSPDGRLLASASEDGTLRVWSVADGVETAVLRGHFGPVLGCAFSPDGAVLASAGQDGTVRLWDAATGVEQTELAGHGGPVRSCAFSPDGAVLASAGEDGTIRLWDAATGARRRELAGAGGEAGEVRKVVFSSGGHLVAYVCEDGTVHLWHVETGAHVTVPTPPSDKVLTCDFSPDGSTLATAAYGQVRLWDVSARTERTAFTGHGSAIWACAFSPDGSLFATASMDQSVRLWRVADGTERAVLAGPVHRMDGCAFAPAGAHVATVAGDGTATLWDVPGGSASMVLRGNGSKLSACAFSPDGTLLATVGNDRSARLWRLSDGSEQLEITGHADWVRGCAFSPDGTVLATASADGTVRLWRVADGDPIAVLRGHRGRVYTCAFSPNGALLASAGTDRTIRLWSVRDRTTLTVLTGHADLINKCAFSPDGTTLATASDDRTVRLWRLPDGRERAAVRGHTGWVDDCAFSPDSTVFATAGGDATVRIWRVSDGGCLCALRFGTPATGIAWHPNGEQLGVATGAGVNLLTYRA